ncbi:MAG TPA: hypothetical protein DD611_01310 [Alphaproteobacteria bacterium]|nr:hypothetical protein [Alphaproteobacteria bacterium]
MSRQIQFRRGTADEHKNFIGAVGEITVDTTNQTLRVHDGVTAGGTMLARQSDMPDATGWDYVVAWQVPTAENNYTWYRKYRSGRVEQGGKATGSSNIVITLPVTMADVNYTHVLSVGIVPQNTSVPTRKCIAKTTSTITASSTYATGGSSAYDTGETYWLISGIAA